MKIGRTSRARASARLSSRKFVVESAVERLDVRALPAISAFVASGVLNVVGNSAPDTITVRRVGDTISIDGLATSYVAGDLLGVSVDGGGGNDRISLATAAGQVALGLPASVFGGAANDTITGSDGGDNLSGGLGADSISGGPGNDSLAGNEQNDKLYGDDGDDSLQGGLGTNYLYGGNGNDTLGGDTGIDYLYGETGDDSLRGEAGNDKLYGADGADILSAGLGTNYLYGGNGGDNLFGDAGVDNLYGDAGDDTLRGEAGNDKLFGGDDRDMLYGGVGNDQFRGEAGDDILVAIGGGVMDSLYGGTGLDNFWGDSEATEKYLDVESAETAGLTIHKVGSFYGGISRELSGQDLADPTIIASGWNVTYQDFSGNPLFRPEGPLHTDVNQGMVGDCYFLAGLAATADHDPAAIERAVVDLGDGTYAIRYFDGTAETYIRVDNDLAAFDWGVPAYAQLGSAGWGTTDGPMWVAILEKAFTYFRSGAGTYASIEAGWMDEPFSALGIGSYFDWGWSNSTQIANRIRDDFQAGLAVTFGTWGSQPTGSACVGGHAYVVVDVLVDASNNVTGIVARNPWGTDGVSGQGNDDGYVTLSVSSLINVVSATVSGLI